MAKLVIADQAEAGVDTPASGKYAFFIDSGILKIKDSLGAVVEAGGGEPPAREISFNIDGDGAIITTGEKVGYYPVAAAGTIVGWRVVGYPSGSIVVDILKASADYPIGADSMTGGNSRPTLSSQKMNGDTDLSDWTTQTIAIGDILGVNVISVTDCELVTVTLKVI